MVVFKDQPVYLLAGTEQYLKEGNLAKIKSSFLDNQSADLNFNVFYAGSASVEMILECANTLPFLGHKRVVLVRQVEDFSPSDKKLILSYVKAPQSKTLLVLETSANNLDEKFFAEICKYAQLIFCPPLKDSRIFAWIEAFVEAKEKRIAEQAQVALVNNLGNNLQTLASSLNNLILYIGEKEMIELGDVEKLVGRDLNTSAFELFAAIIVLDKAKAWHILNSLFKDGINSSQILGALAHQMVSERNRVSSSLFTRCLLNLQKTDSDIKTGKLNQKIALELLLVRLLGLFQLAH